MTRKRMAQRIESPNPERRESRGTRPRIFQDGSDEPEQLLRTEYKEREPSLGLGNRFVTPRSRDPSCPHPPHRYTGLNGAGQRTSDAKRSGRGYAGGQCVPGPRRHLRLSLAAVCRKTRSGISILKVQENILFLPMRPRSEGLERRGFPGLPRQWLMAREGLLPVHPSNRPNRVVGLTDADSRHRWPDP